MFLQKLTSLQTLRALMRWLPRAVIFVCLIMLVGLWYPHWPLELIISFAPQVVFVLLGALLLIATTYIYCTIRSDTFFTHKANQVDSIVVLLSIIFIILVSWIVFARGMQQPLSPSGDTPLRLATYNMLYSNDDTQSIVNELREQSVSIVGLQEITEEKMQAIQTSLQFNYGFITDSDVSAQDTEIALVSRYPIVSSELLYGYENGGIVRNELEVDGQIISVYVVHFTPPYSASDFSKRESLFTKLADFTTIDQNPVFIMGDFNTTVFSPHMQTFARRVEAKVTMSSKRHLPQCSWYGLGDMLCARIDYIFVPKDTAIENVIIGHDVGSDHRPVITEISR